MKTNKVLTVIAIAMILAVVFLDFPATPNSVVHGYPPPPVATGYPPPVTTVSPRSTPRATPTASSTYPVIIDYPFNSVGNSASQNSTIQNTVQPPEKNDYRLEKRPETRNPCQLQRLNILRLVATCPMKLDR